MPTIPIDWANDVIPMISAYLAQPLVIGPTAFIVTIALGTLAARALIGVFFKRD
jgi:hypothetical protein